MADQGAEGFLSPYLRNKRFQAAIPFLKGSVLDFGCGTGKLAAYVPSEHYLGVDADEVSLHEARVHFPRHRFEAVLPDLNEKFDTIVALAVIEHTNDPARFLCTLAAYLSESAAARLIVTTPHPSVARIHAFGAAIGLFSRHAREEHKDLLDYNHLCAAAAQAGLTLTTYRRFLFGANQIAILRKQAAKSTDP